MLPSGHSITLKVLTSILLRMYHDFGIELFASLKIQKECAIALEEYDKLQRHVFSVSLSPIDVSNMI